MRPARYAITAALACVLFIPFVPASAGAQVKTEERTLVRFEGMLGRIAGLFGGRAAREGVVTTTAVRGDRKMSITGDTAELIDLAEERIYNIDMRRRTYTVTTFDELRQQMQQAMAKAEQTAAQEPDPPAEQTEAGEPQFEIDFDLRESGQRRAVHGHGSREVVMTIAVRERGRTLEDSGGLLLTANTWLAGEIAGGRALAEFDRRYAEKLAGIVAAGASAEQMAAARAMYPGLQEALSRMQEENVNLDGTPVSMTMTVQAVGGEQEAAAAQEQQEQPPPGLGGVLGGLGRRLGRGQQQQQQQQQPSEPGRVTIMTMTHELLSVSTDVNPDDVAIPAGFQQR